MVLLFADRNSKIEKEIVEMLCSYGGNYISDKRIFDNAGKFTVTSCYKSTELDIKNGIAVFCDKTERFENQTLPENIIGICEESNTTALSVFKKNGISAIICGMNPKNTITISSLNENTLFAALQRAVTADNGKILEPQEYRITLNKSYKPFSVMASVAVLLLNSIKPDYFGRKVQSD